jgi:hypothetical protein
VRIVVDVTPLSHARTGVGNYLVGALRGLCEAAGDEHEVVAYAPTSPGGARNVGDALDGLPVDIVFVLIAPEGAGADHLKALARVARVLRNQSVLEQVRKIRDPAAIYAILAESAAQAA